MIRVVHVWCSFTLEASFAGPDTGALAGSHYDMAHLESLGANLALALLDYSHPDKAAQAAQQALHQPALPAQSRQCDGEFSGSMSDGTTVVCCSVVLFVHIDDKQWKQYSMVAVTVIVYHLLSVVPSFEIPFGLLTFKLLQYVYLSSAMSEHTLPAGTSCRCLGWPGHLPIR